MDDAESSHQATTRVAVGGYVLEVGHPAGTVIVGDAPQDDSRALAKILKQSSKQQSPPEVLDTALADTSRMTSRLEHALGLFKEIAEGRVDPASVSDEVDILLDLLGRLDRDERWRDALSVARSLATLLALLGRWIDLLRSLRLALGIAERLGDDNGKAWALHELGTLHLAAGDHAKADTLLTQAHDIRKRTMDRRSLAITERNLHALCRALRVRLHETPHQSLFERIMQVRRLAFAFIVSLLFIGGAAGAAIRGSTHSTTAAHEATNASAKRSNTGESKHSEQSPPPLGTTSSTSNGALAPSATSKATATGKAIGTSKSEAEPETRGRPE